MKRLSRLLELPVVDFRTGKQIARVERCCLSADGQNLCGLVVRQNGFGRRRRYVEFSTLAVIGDVSLQVKALAPLPDPLKRAEDENRRVYNTSGRLLGWMTDALLDESDGCPKDTWTSCAGDVFGCATLPGGPLASSPPIPYPKHLKEDVPMQKGGSSDVHHPTHKTDGAGLCAGLRGDHGRRRSGRERLSAHALAGRKTVPQIPAQAGKAGLHALTKARAPDARRG